MRERRLSMRNLPDNYLNVDQGTPEWLAARTGQVTASRVKDVVGKLKNGKESAARASYKLEMLSEILTGKAVEHFVSMAMDFGSENEPLARACYEIEKGVEVERIGYVKHPAIERAGASPDGLVGDDGLVEIKVPNTTTHLQYLIAEEVPSDYIPQMMWQMACTGRQWCDFVSYDPRLPSDFGLFVIRLHRDDKQIGEMEREVERFIVEVNEMAERLLKYRSSSAGTPPPRAEMPATV
jgi:putative phage-type endonuclease